MALAPRAIELCGTPCFAFSWSAVARAYQAVTMLATEGLPIRHWLSVKTQPLPCLLKCWRESQFGGVEVVSEFELLAALTAGYCPDDIVVNGVAKHHWLAAHRYPHLRVHYDSLDEVRTLADIGRQLEWRVGLRFSPQAERDPDEPDKPTQFGLDRVELAEATRFLLERNIEIYGVHFHLRTDVQTPACFDEAIRDTADACRCAAIEPRYLDCGGGLPASACARAEGSAGCHYPFDLSELKRIVQAIPSHLPSVREVWFENGRFMTARAGVLIIKVLDIKVRNGLRFLVCDGGRTNHAIVSDWETHELMTIPPRAGERQLTTVCGPTCMSYDRLGRFYLPRDVSVGDYVLWLDAGAYHLPWETRFSHGLAPVVWIDDDGVSRIVRARETFTEWWGHCSAGATA